MFRKWGYRGTGGTVALDGGLWTVYRQFGPCSGLSRAVDIEDQAILGNREDLKLLVEGESAITHSLYVLHAPAVKGDPRGSSQFTQPGVQPLSPPCPPAHLLQGYSHWGIGAGISHAFPGLWREWG